MTLDKANILELVIKLALDAGIAIMEVYNSDEKINIEIKPDQSPVTDADYAANKIIIEGLKKITPDLPILSEEGALIPFATRSTWSQYWLVDPLDGTKEFIHRTNEFTVNIALVENNIPTLGVVYAPYYDECYFAAQNMGAFKKQGSHSKMKIQVRKFQKEKPVVVVSRRHGKASLHAFLAKFGSYELINKGSSLKSCMVAEGLADVYPCLGHTSEWDTAAAQCVVNQAGGALLSTELKPLHYNTKTSLINPPFIAVGDVSHQWEQYF